MFYFTCLIVQDRIRLWRTFFCVLVCILLVYPEQKVGLRDNTDLRYKLIKGSIFVYDVKQLFKNNFITQFKLNICCKSLEQYTFLNSDPKRCLQLSVFQNECDIIIKYCEVFVKIFF